MAYNPGIICFRHCCSESIFCKSVPKLCPICQSCIINCNIEPFLVPYPYTNATYHPVAIVVRPSQGSFINDYTAAKDLHIGVTNSKGIVFEFDRQGLIVNDHCRWTDCVAFKIVPSSWENHWDETLERMLKDTKWKSKNYDEVDMNCCNFVMEFVNNLQYTNIKFASKEDMCNELIMSKIQDAIKYNYVLKKLEKNDYFKL
ncbi:hypothetical protein WN55_00814 [Dufourea novaeangliae]|uniref:MKRN2 opposite strand protein n=1 Tax=Dufourea novaeangliae TaxID=178035 RepID=A0A154PCX9_DUFNO|nr:hypothetical protein WN55_00814 [Dufourea novaeangliae]